MIHTDKSEIPLIGNELIFELSYIRIKNQLAYFPLSLSLSLSLSYFLL